MRIQNLKTILLTIKLLYVTSLCSVLTCCNQPNSKLESPILVDFEYTKKVPSGNWNYFDNDGNLIVSIYYDSLGNAIRKEYFNDSNLVFVDEDIDQDIENPNEGSSLYNKHCQSCHDHSHKLIGPPLGFKDVNRDINAYKRIENHKIIQHNLNQNELNEILEFSAKSTKPIP